MSVFISIVNCDSCSAFSVTSSLEYQIKQKTGKLSLSKQDLVDCSKSYGTNGWTRGWMHNAFDYIIDHGLALESSYPYQGKEGTAISAPKAAACRDYNKLSSGDEPSLQQAVGLRSVAIEASLALYKSYKNGEYYDPNYHPGNINHAVLAVGYGTENGNACWLIQNSCGTGWGNKRYIKMARNCGNHYGISDCCVYPIV
ncbi:LOW QUALITY PROTEIN: digestive cysteine proteinase 2-like [Aquarana catesbeiana]|uniref:LOW QUALITY PROTEIN: digestive cysteine proteinase 2-like n=1 Tax=Aquarana catesbeiana TaxID=8400 RepID=UPI003CC9F443